MDNGQGKKAGLDLGLAALLSVSESRPDAQPAVSAEPHAAAITPEPAPVPVSNDFEKLADAKEWSALLKHCEGRLAPEHSDHLEARLWWVTSSLKTRSMPVALLTAPLDAATKDLSFSTSDPRIASLAAGALGETAGALEHTGDGDSAIGLLQRAFALDKKREKDLAGLVQRELARLREHKGLSTKQSKERDAKVATLSALGATLMPIAPLTKKVSEVRESKDSKKIARAKTSWTLPPMSPRFAVAALAVALLISAGWFCRGAFGFFRSQSGIPDFETALAAQPPEPKVPTLARIDDVSAFDGLYYDLKDVQLPQRAVAQPQRATAPVARKEPLDMNGPHEPQEVSQAIAQPEGPPEDHSAEILFGGGSPRKSIDVAYNSTQPVQHAGENFPIRRVYKVLTKTQILAQPNQRNSVVGTLDPGQRISADGRMNDWLQIRSSSGRIGYVSMQDAELE